MSVTTVAILLLAVFVGGAFQRLAGMGFGMVVAPIALLLLPGQAGIVFANLLGVVAALALVWPVWKDIEWKRFAYIAGASLAGAAGGAAIAGALDVNIFRIVVGSVLLVAIVGAQFVGRLTFTAPERSSAIAAGGVTGALVAMSGIGGPPMAVYAVVTRWDPRGFSATMQPFVALSSCFGAAAVLVGDPTALPALTAVQWVLAVVALAGGLVVGILLGRVITTRVAGVIVVCLGVFGAASAVVSGIAGVLA